MKEILENRLSRLRDSLREEDLQAVIIYGRENTRYLTGFSGSTSLALITLDQSLIFVDSRYTTQASQECVSSVVIQEQGSLNNAVCNRIEDLEIKDIGLEDETISLAMFNEIKAKLSWQHLHGLSKSLAQLRWVKDASELGKIREAVRIADAAFAEVKMLIKAGMRETEVAALLEYKMKLLGADKPSFDTIVASGLRSALPHGIASEKVIEDGDIIVIDFGAMYQGYCSDMTRTVFVGTPNPKLVEIYNIVLEAQEKAETALKAGVLGKTIHKIAADTIADAGYGAYFGHGLGHSLGLEIHEEPRLNALSETIMPAGVLMTAEPGIYLPELGGVRIEDTVLITEQGIEILTQTPKAIEFAMI